MISCVIDAQSGCEFLELLKNQYLADDAICEMIDKIISDAYGTDCEFKDEGDMTKINHELDQMMQYGNKQSNFFI
jgi:hypothetical protein